MSSVAMGCQRLLHEIGRDLVIPVTQTSRWALRHRPRHTAPSTTDDIFATDARV